MKKVFVTTLRNKSTDTKRFREATKQTSMILASEISKELKTKKTLVKTPFKETQGYELKQKITLVPILRAGIGMLYPFLEFFKDASVGFVGLKRDEKTAIAKLYYSNISPINNGFAIILDPTIATGGSAVECIRAVKNAGAKEENIFFSSIFCATPGLKQVKKEFPRIKIFYAVEDPILNKDKFIVPGLGDFGDRYFGT